MTSIYRTAYPRFYPNQKLKAKELKNDYSLSDTELAYIKQNIRSDNLKLGFAVLLKVFQKMGYFPENNLIHQTIVKHIKEQIPYIKPSTEFIYDHESSLNRHRRRVYDCLKIKRYDKQVRSYAIKIAYNTAQTMNFPADMSLFLNFKESIIISH